MTARQAARVQPALRKFPTTAAFYDAAATAFVDAAVAAVDARGCFSVALAGGGTPRPLYARLAAAPYRDRVDWSRVQVFFGDERCVLPDHPRSNYRMAREALLDAVALPVANIHRPRGEDEPHAAARQYAEELRSVFGDDGLPRFDLILLGIGDNGHTASLFPGTGALRETGKTVCAQYVEVQHEWRLTCTLPLINAARAVWVLVEGAGKADIVRRVLRDRFEPEVLPMQAVAPAGDYVWWLDAAAAAKL